MHNMKPDHKIVFNGKDLSEYGIWISGEGTYDSPERDVESISIPGRNGDLIVDNGRFKNMPVKYPAFIVRGFEERFDAFRAFILSTHGYCRLEDDFHREEYRLGQCAGSLLPNVSAKTKDGMSKADVGTFDLIFNCKPQRFLKAGDIPVEFDTDSAIMNFTLYEAKPLIRAYGTGTFGIGDSTVTITQADEYTDIDCDLMDAYKGGVNCNANVELNSDDYPTLAPGENGVMLDGISRLIIYPRYYTI